MKIGDRVIVNKPHHSFHAFDGEVIRLHTIDGQEHAEVDLFGGQRELDGPVWRGGSWIFLVSNLTKVGA
jgi:hypothetical protein